MEQMRALSPTVKIVARGSSLKVLGAKREVMAFERKMNALVEYYVKYGHISKEVVSQAFSTGLSDAAEPVAERDTIVYGNNGNIIHPIGADAGADLVSFHLESDSDVMETINIIRSCGKKVGIVDDVVSTGASLDGLEKIVKKAGGYPNEDLKQATKTIEDLCEKLER